MRGVDIIETILPWEGGILSTWSIVSRKWGVSGEFLTIFEVKEGTPHSDMSDLVVPDTEKGG